jgi:hypothetical protein
MVNILVYTVSPFSFICGGLVVQYELCRILDSLGVNIRIRAPDNIKNSIFSKYYNNNFDLNNTIVIYGETIEGNPLNAPHVVRWILAPIGIVCNPNIVNSWSKTDLVYYFNSDKSFPNSKELIDKKYKTLTAIYINPLIKNYNDPKRKGWCHTYRKSNYHTTLKNAHPPNSLEMQNGCKLMDCINIFNKRQYFISYDPLTFLSVIAALCGCISIVVKVDGQSETEWLQTTAAFPYLKKINIEKLYGIAYGISELEWAKNTLHLVPEQWINILEFVKNESIITFLNDIKDLNTINTLENTINNIF